MHYIRRASHIRHQTPRTIRVPASPKHRAYTRHISGGRTYVKSALIRNRGSPGKGKKLFSLTPGKLYGYSVSASPVARRRSLRTAVSRNGALTVFRRLQALMILNKRTAPLMNRTIRKNRNWVRQMF